MASHAVFSFDDVSNASFTTSSAASEANREFATKRLGLKGSNYAARLAIGRSLAVLGEPEPCDDAAGQVIKGRNLFGDGADLRTWVSLLVEHGPTEAADIPKLQDLVRRHWARGVRLLGEEWTACGEDHDKFILRLAAQASLRGDGKPVAPGKRGGAGGTAFIPRAVPVRLPIGPRSVEVRSGAEVVFPMNAKGNSPHVAIMGTLGTGKTVVARSMLVAAHQQSGCPVLVFDMGKGDLAGNADFVRSLSAQVLEPPRVPVPLDVLHVTGDDPVVIAKAALRFRESFARVPQNSRLGDVQIAAVGEATERAFGGSRPVKLSDVHDRLREVYAERRRKDDNALGTFDDLAKFRTFDPKMSPAEFFSKSWVIDVHTLPEFVQRVVVFLVLDAAHAYLTEVADSAVDADGNRALRLLICVDEARRVLAYDQAGLIGLVRESRSKGGAVITISQSPDDFAGNDDDFLDNIGIGICLRTNAKPGPVTRMLGRAEDLSGLKTGEAVTRLQDKGFVRIQAWEDGSKLK